MEAVKDVYALLVKTGDSPQCIEKWSTTLNVQVDAKVTFGKVYKTTEDPCLRWFQYRILHQILPVGRLFFFTKNTGFIPLYPVWCC